MPSTAISKLTLTSSAYPGRCDTPSQRFRLILGNFHKPTREARRCNTRLRYSDLACVCTAFHFLCPGALVHGVAQRTNFRF
ncbi:hypothetical protein OE88DRAFT_241594 [Heliocybe sulcata]|uniref:Uncharacterized protein n=1 Tax=Heliocybe sulcata TaxID=5364 RepID=A0A5C3N938_9AGAM|nr:hypothetical protein OE88DRAFT_241594 [Heliocybe sulcata]